SGTSIFDPVLCEIAYRWFCPQGGTVLDPFAGGSVRGIVASQLGRAYVGIELRAEQVAANQAQAALGAGPALPGGPAI
ncbi:MAG: DNA methyltransferase, partial [Albidovulum sp.]|uniref:DNA methyltransferase n=1 Tax=Albidovulum sp. TaxID=1872424 RepID=UPI003C878BD6